MKTTILPLGLVLILGACRSTTANGLGGPVRRVAVAMQGDERVHQDLELRDPRVTRDTMGRAAEFELVNRSGSALEFLYSIDWYDARNARIEVLPQEWQPARLAPHASMRVHAVAPTARAESFRLLAQRPSAFDH